ncbi:MAG: SGNH/GDSL hydrolase family protein [Puia sp.]|nr:SGNH/GDSL hydrolase family protein [Puia sp.]
MHTLRFAFICCIALIAVGYPSRAQKTQDWPNFARYHAENDSLNGTVNRGDRVVFMGNSITDSWIRFSPEFFANNHFIDRGISGQTTPQMLVRFRADVISLRPKAVVMLCGINDIAGNTGPSTLEMIEDNIMSMAELAKANKIKVILSSVLPAYDFPWNPGSFPAEKIIALNAWIREYAHKNRWAYLDYYPAMVDERKGMKAEYSSDGVHPNKLGYQVMEKIAEPVIREEVKLQR